MIESEIRKYAELMNELGLTGLEINEKKGTIRLERGVGISQPLQVATPSLTKAVSTLQETLENRDSLKEVKSPLVGVFYQAPMENADPFVKVGDKVSKGDVLAIVEAMKLMNEITSDFDGIVREICVSNGEAVDFGRVLFKIEEA